MNVRHPHPTAPKLPQWVVLCVAGSVFLAASAAHNTFGILASLKLSLLLLALSMGGMAINMPAWRPMDARESRLFKLLGVIVFIAFLGVPFAIVKGAAFGRLTDQYMIVVLTAVLVWGVCRTTENRLTVVRALLLGLVTACVLALRAGNGNGRLEGAAVYDANDLALVANLSIPLLGWYYLDRRNRWRWMALLAIPIPLLTILRSDSRGGILGLLAMALAVSLFYSRRAPRPLRRIFPAIACLGLLSVPFIPASTIQRMASIGDPSQDYNVTSEVGRVALWKRGMGYALSSPIVGVGFNNFSAAEGRSDAAIRALESGTGFKWGAAHSVYVEILAELGFIAGGALIALILLTTRDLLRAARSRSARGDPDAIFLGLFGISFIGFAVCGVFLSWAFYPIPHIMYAIAYGAFNALDRPVGGPLVVPGRANRGRRMRPRPRRMVRTAR